MAAASSLNVVCAPTGCCPPRQPPSIHYHAAHLELESGGPAAWPLGSLVVRRAGLTLGMDDGRSEPAGLFS